MEEPYSMRILLRSLMLGTLFCLASIIFIGMGVNSLITADQIYCQGQPLPPGGVCQLAGSNDTITYEQLVERNQSFAWQMLGGAPFLLVFGVFLIWYSGVTRVRRKASYTAQKVTSSPNNAFYIPSQAQKAPSSPNFARTVKRSQEKGAAQQQNKPGDENPPPATEP